MGLVSVRWGPRLCFDVEPPGQKLFDTIDGIIGDAADDICETVLRIEVVELYGAEKGVHGDGSHLRAAITRVAFDIHVRRREFRVGACRFDVPAESLFNL